MDQFEPAEGAASARRPGRWAFATRTLLLAPAAALAAAPTSSHLATTAAVAVFRPQAIAAAAARITPADVLPLTPESALTINARRPFEDAVLGLTPFRFSGGTLDQLRAVDCLAAAAYYEAGDDPSGERAVVQVVLNRVRHPAFPKTVCGVVFQGSERRTGCQFTFTCDGALGRVPSRSAWIRAQAIAGAALAGAVDPRVGTATHYHADYVVPYWSSSLVKLAQVGAHIFYRWPGQWGQPRAFLKSARAGEPAVPLLASLGRGTGSVHREPDGAPPQLADLTGAPLIRPPGTAAVGNGSAEPARTSTAEFMLADASTAPGRWAMAALGKCSGRADCQVLVYGRGDQLERNRAAAPESREAPLFLLIRDGSSGMTVFLWDCRQVQRSNPDQCLPEGAAGLRRLLRDRPRRPASPPEPTAT